MAQAEMLDGVLEVPLTVYTDGLGRQRPAQLTAISFGEMKAILNDAISQKWSHFVLLSHSFELLDGRRTRKNPVVVRRFVKLCEYLSANRELFRTVNFSSPAILPYDRQTEPLTCGSVTTLGRLVEQAWSRVQ